MNKKTKIIIGSVLAILLTVIIVLFSLKGKVDEKLSDEALTKLKDISKNLPFELYFEDVFVNSTGPYVELNGVEIIEDGVEISFDKIKIGTSFEEILKMFSDKEINKIESIFLEMSNAVVNNYDMQLKHKIFSNIKISYEGEISQRTINKMKNRGVLPDSDQKISVKILDFSLPSEIYDEMYNEFPNNINYTKLNETPTDMNFDMELLTEQKIIKFKGDSENNGQYSGSTEFDIEMKFIGDKFDEIEPKSIDIDGSFDADLNGFLIEENGLEMEMNEFSGSINSSFDIDDSMTEEEILREMNGDFKFEVNDFSVKLPYQATIGMPAGLLENNELEVNKMYFSMGLKEGDIYGDLDYNSSIGKIKSNFNFGINMRNPDDSFINNWEVYISNLPDQLEELVKTYEIAAGELPRKNNKIYLKIYGSLQNPKIEGVNLF